MRTSGSGLMASSWLSNCCDVDASGPQVRDVMRPLDAASVFVIGFRG